MELPEFINRLETIRDQMESTFRNEFLKGEIENLIEGLKSSPEVLGKIEDITSTVNIGYASIASHTPSAKLHISSTGCVGLGLTTPNIIFTS